MPARKGEESRDRNRHLKVVVSERERAEIETRAAATGLSVSAYLRNLGLGFQPHSTLDQEAILSLLKVNADQGRLGGLVQALAVGAKRGCSGDPGDPEAARCHRGVPAETQGSYRVFIGRILTS